MHKAYLISMHGVASNSLASILVKLRWCSYLQWNFFAFYFPILFSTKTLESNSTDFTHLELDEDLEPDLKLIAKALPAWAACTDCTRCSAGPPLPRGTKNFVEFNYVATLASFTPIKFFFQRLKKIRKQEDEQQCDFLKKMREGFLAI